MIAIGEHYFGPEHRNSRISMALSTASDVIIKLRPRDTEAINKPWVNPIFVVAGTLGSPNFDGIRLGHFDKKENGLVVEIAVPQTIVDASNLCAPIVNGLHMANAAAFHFFEDKGMEFPLRDAEELVAKVGTSLSEFV